MNGVENRKFPRADTIFKLNYGTERSPSFEAMTRDISLGGISFKSNEEFEPGDQIELKFSIKELSGEIKAKGRVVRSWSEGGDPFTAVEFIEINSSDHEILENFFKSYNAS